MRLIISKNLLVKYFCMKSVFSSILNKYSSSFHLNWSLFYINRILYSIAYLYIAVSKFVDIDITIYCKSGVYTVHVVLCITFLTYLLYSTLFWKRIKMLQTVLLFLLLDGNHFLICDSLGLSVEIRIFDRMKEFNLLLFFSHNLWV